MHIEDAAAATVAALECPPGVYNVVDEDPSELSVWLPAFAAFLGAPEPPRVTEEEALRSAGPDAVYYATRLRGASNRRAKEKLGFCAEALGMAGRAWRCSVIAPMPFERGAGWGYNWLFSIRSAFSRLTN